MSMIDMEMAILAINNKKECCFFAGSRPNPLIEEAEHVLGVSFPPTYRRFLREFGCGSIGSQEIYGIVDSNFYTSSVPDAIWVTLQQRKISNISNSLVIIGSLGDGDFIAIICNKSNGDGAIVRYSPESDNEFEEKIASDFGEFILEITHNEL